MARLSKKQKESISKIDPKKNYTLKEASVLVKEISTTNFDASIDLAIRLGVDPKKANQMVRGVVTLPNGTGKQVRVLALVTPDKEADAKERDEGGFEKVKDAVNDEAQPSPSPVRKSLISGKKLIIKNFKAIDKTNN